jgi:hypothetical protein
MLWKCQRLPFALHDIGERDAVRIDHSGNGRSKKVDSSAGF